jgi:hypothetical protein
MTTTDIFIKTYKGDFVWLDFLLRSIKKFATGFRDVIIVSDDDGNKIPDSIVNIMPVKIYYTTLPKSNIPECTQPIGYVWQQAVKLEWRKYTDADNILILDSDEMLSENITPDSFKEDGKFRWFYRNWELVGDAICWKPLTDHFLKISSKYESMCVTGFILTRNSTARFFDYINSLYTTQSIWDSFLCAKIKGISEYNAFGNFLLESDDVEYIKKINATDLGINSTIIKSWSWGGLKEEDKQRREHILNE